jgi:hypothetical protein
MSNTITQPEPLESPDDSTLFNTLDRFINKKKTVEILSATRITKTKTTKQINHEIIKYKDKEFVVCCIPFNEEYKIFVIDIDKKDQVINKAWHFRSDGNYIGASHIDNNIKKELYLHNFVMDKLTFEGKGQQHTIDHINRIGTDNRKCNLREVSSQSAQNFNQKKRERTTELPTDCDIDINLIPKNIYYGKPSGLHGDFFYIELKGIPALCIDGKKYNWKSTKSKAVNLKLKLQQTIDKLIQLKNQHRELDDIIYDSTTESDRNNLITEYNEIIQLSHYPSTVIQSNIQNFIELNQQTNHTVNETSLNTIKKIKDSGHKKDNLPTDCGITIDQVPPYCYFKKESDKRGCKFVIDRHPKLDVRSWSTTESKKVSIIDKFNQLIARLEELNS